MHLFKKVLTHEVSIFLLDCVGWGRGKAEGEKGIFPGMEVIEVFEATIGHPRKNFEAESDLPRQNSVTLEKLPRQNSGLCYTLRCYFRYCTVIASGGGHCSNAYGL